MQTEIFEVDPDDFAPAELERPARLLAHGGLVVFPTETVYGIGANAHDPETLHRLRVLKDRPPEKPFTLHIAEIEDAARHVPHISVTARRLMQRFWPGPLTIVLPGGADVGLGLRLPSHPIARALIRLAGCPVVAPSANPAGELPATSGQRARALYEGRVEAIIDSGTTAIREASTVVRLDGDQATVLREGLISADMIQRVVRGKRVLFVCTGNSCRSPMAMALMRKLLAERLGVPMEELAEHGLHIASAGVAAFNGGQASDHAVEVMAERGLDLSAHRARRVTEDLAREADLIIAMAHSHVWQLLQWDRSLRDRAHVICELGISDPIGGTAEEYEQCAAEIEQHLRADWVERVLAS